jgi:hypothetical protein
LRIEGMGCADLFSQLKLTVHKVKRHDRIGAAEPRALYGRQTYAAAADNQNAFARFNLASVDYGAEAGNKAAGKSRADFIRNFGVKLYKAVFFAVGIFPETRRRGAGLDGYLAVFARIRAWFAKNSDGGRVVQNHGRSFMHCSQVPQPARTIQAITRSPGLTYVTLSRLRQRFRLFRGPTVPEPSNAPCSPLRNGYRCGISCMS